ncbi:MAG TPA: PilZ domain-containing protein [Candidatus Methylomirabilis sp.]|jgi:uncharacterized protein (TIGR02266 family)|nr:PilZ domain-containing protein [Candidatus Methylomirabilis sp.]
MEGSPAEKVPVQRRGHARFPVYLPARCHLKAPDGRPLELLGKTRDLSEKGALLLLPQPLLPSLSLTVELDTIAGPAARPGQVKWIGKSEPTPLGGLLVPHGIAFERALERAFVEAVLVQGRPPDPRVPIEVRVDYDTVLSGRSVNLSQSGIFVRTAEPLTVNRLLALRFRLPGLGEEFQVRGKVVWSNPRPGRSYPQGMGIQFLDLPPALTEEFAGFVAEMRRELGLDRVSDLFGRPVEEENGHEPASL